jgi:uncharacterized protein
MTGTGTLTEISSAAELTGLLGTPAKRALTKERTRLHARDVEWLAASTCCLVATSGADGTCDVSPKGDPPGFALILDEQTIAIPERPGSEGGWGGGWGADGFRNILENPHVGLIFLIPGRKETLRINGRARLIRDAPWFGDMLVKGHRPQLALLVEIEQIFFHCMKAFMRSGLWEPDTWNPDAVPPHAQIVKSVQPCDETLEELERHYGPQYESLLYG